MGTQITLLIIELITCIVVFLTARFIIPSVKNTVGEDKFNKLLDWITKFVEAAEQITKESGAGRKKYEYVCNLVNAKMIELGLDLSVDDIKCLIESTVYKMNKEK